MASRSFTDVNIGTVAIELKYGKNKLPDKQKTFLHLLHDNNVATVTSNCYNQVVHCSHELYEDSSSTRHLTSLVIRNENPNYWVSHILNKETVLKE